MIKPNIAEQTQNHSMLNNIAKEEKSCKTERNKLIVPLLTDKY